MSNSSEVNKNTLSKVSNITTTFTNSFSKSKIPFSDSS